MHTMVGRSGLEMSKKLIVGLLIIWKTVPQQHGWKYLANWGDRLFFYNWIIRWHGTVGFNGKGFACWDLLLHVIHLNPAIGISRPYTGPGNHIRMITGYTYYLPPLGSCRNGGYPRYSQYMRNSWPPNPAVAGRYDEGFQRCGRDNRQWVWHYRFSQTYNAHTSGAYQAKRA